MARDFTIPGESLVYVKGNVNTIFPSLTQLALATDQIRVTSEVRHKDLKVNAWGEAPPDVQMMLAWATIRMNVIHVDPVILQAVVAESMGGVGFGQTARAGTRLGGNNPRFGAGWHYVGLNIAAPVDGLPWRFYHAYLTGPPFEWPLGTEASVITLNFRAIPYTQDPANIVGGVITGAQGYTIWDRVLDS